MYSYRANYCVFEPAACLRQSSYVSTRGSALTRRRAGRHKTLAVVRPYLPKQAAPMELNKKNNLSLSTDRASGAKGRPWSLDRPKSGSGYVRVEGNKGLLYMLNTLLINFLLKGQLSPTVEGQV